VEHGTHPSITDLFWPAVNFLLFLWLLVRFVRGPVQEFFRARTERIREGLLAGSRARQEAEDLRQKLQQDIEELPALRDRLRSDVRSTAERQREKLLESAQSTAARIRKDAGLIAAQEIAAARRGVRSEVIDEAVRQARELVRAAAGPDDQQRLVREFVHQATAGGAR